MIITSLKAREILDSRGIPTIETTLELDKKFIAKAAVPSGASTGSKEVLEMRDGDTDRYFGSGVLKAVEKVNNELATALIGKDFQSQEELDNAMINLDGTEQKSRLGGNSILSISMAFARASSQLMEMPLYEYFGRAYWGAAYKKKNLSLPEPMILIMEGGKHGSWATDIQEYMIVPLRSQFPNFSDSLRAGAEIFKATHDLLVSKGYSSTVGFEGAFAPIQIQSNEEAFQIIMQGIEIAGYKPGKEIMLSMDVAASEFFDRSCGKYELKSEERELNAKEWIDLQGEWIEKYPIMSIEDPLHEEDWGYWAQFTERFGDQIQVVGDDLLTTNTERIQTAIAQDAVNAVLIKLNQIGTVTETLKAIKLSHEAGYTSIISHRGGETNDDMIADLVVGTDAVQCKFGGPDRGERVAKYNRLTEIETELL